MIVNDFTLFDRTWKVVIQAEPQFRAKPSNVGTIYVRNGNGDMVPLATMTKLSAEFLF